MRNDAIEEIEEKLPLPNNSEYDPNHTLIATFNSISDTNNFCNMYNHDNRYNGLKLGQRIQINDGSYNKAWYIAGFDCEYNNIASDGTPNNNGYGICLFPENELFSGKYNSKTPSYGYSYTEVSIHTSTLPTVANNLRNILDDHLINRNVLLCTQSANGYYNYQWFKSYAELISVGQVIGVFGFHNSSYDDGEANYQLPLFNHLWPSSRYIWTRNKNASALNEYPFVINGNVPGTYSPDTTYIIGTINIKYTTYDLGSVSSMIYIR